MSPENTVPISVTGYAHVRLTVTDIDRSRAVFGFPVAFEAPPEDADQETKDQLSFLFGGVIHQFGGGLLGLRPVAPEEDRHDADRAGLDHLCFTVASQADLQDAVVVLDDLGIAHEGIKDIGVGHIMEFRDPDDIALELLAPAGAPQDA